MTHLVACGELTTPDARANLQIVRTGNHALNWPRRIDEIFGPDWQIVGVRFKIGLDDCVAFAICEPDDSCCDQPLEDLESAAGREVTMGCEQVSPWARIGSRHLV